MSFRADAEAVAAAVRDFYERHPYPKPVEALGPERAEEAERRADYHLLWPSRSFREDFSILVAGCGTVQAARYAQGWPQARVLGIDVSEASLGSAEALKRKHGLANLELKRLAVEEADRLGESFDQIVCTGVLHHLPDPDAGLRALRGALAPDGRLHLMLYAPYGRAGIYLLQEYNRLLGTGVSSDEVRDLVSTLKLLPQGHPLWPLLRNSPDFRYEAGVADALLHPRDRPYSVPQFLAFLERNGLRFGRWLRQAPYLPHCGNPRQTPHFERLARLGPQAQFAAMELFRGTMSRHSAIVHREDRAPEPPFRLDDETWLDAVPFRLPDTICVVERLPPGKAGVLINRRHIDTDIYLPVDAREKRLVEAIDGKRSFRDLIGLHESADRAKRLLEDLWRHDQIVPGPGGRGDGACP